MPERTLLTKLRYTVRSLASLLGLALLVVGCEPTSERDQAARERRPVVLVGIDGAEWTVIESLWDQGRLPHLRALAESGVRSHLRTDYGKSPVIWTTIATGRVPADHGVTDFVVPTDSGPIPVSSRTRRVPALWNMTTRVGLRTLALGWWATWPAERISGVMISDRAHAPLDDTFSPPEWAPTFADVRRYADTAPDRFRGNPETRTRDEIVTRAASILAREPFALMMAYFRSVDIESHQTWRYFRPETFEPLPAEVLATKRDRIPESYDATDEAIGEMLEHLEGAANVIVVSDHGFHAARRERTKIVVDVDGLLVHLGYARPRSESAESCPQGELTAQGSASGEARQGLRLCPGGPVDRSAIRERLTRDLSTLTWEGGTPAFKLEDASDHTQQGGADFDLVVLERAASRRLVRDGVAIDGVVTSLWTVSGDHGPRTHGIFIASGPDIDTNAIVNGITIHDITPTVLYMLGLPVADDFPGRAWTTLLDADFQRRHGLRRIPSWGERALDPSGKPMESSIDEALVDELRALGYL